MHILKIERNFRCTYELSLRQEGRAWHSQRVQRPRPIQGPSRAYTESVILKQETPLSIIEVTLTCCMLSRHSTPKRLHFIHNLALSGISMRASSHSVSVEPNLLAAFHFHNHLDGPVSMPRFGWRLSDPRPWRRKRHVCGQPERGIRTY